MRSGHFDILASLHGQVGRIAAQAHLLQDVGVLDVVGHRVCQYVMVLWFLD